MLKIFKNMTVRSQLILAIFTSTVIILLIATGIFAYIDVKNRITNTHNLSKMAVNILAQDFVRSVTLDSPDVVVDMASNLEAFSSISHAVFLKNDDVPILIYKRKGEDTIDITPSRDKNIVELENAIRIYLPIIYQDKKYGTAIFQHYKSSFHEQYINFIIDLSLVIPILLILSALLALYFQHFFTKPLIALTDALDNFRGTQKNSVLDEFYPSREISKLFNGFNRMARRIETDSAIIAEQRERFLITLESIVDGVIATDRNGIIIYMNPAAERLTGWEQSEAIGTPINDVYHLIDEDTEKSISGQLDETLLSGTTHHSIEKTALLDKQGKKYLIQSSISPIIDNMKTVIGIVAVFQNITDARRLSHQLRHQATHDPLTDLMNRAQFESIINEELDHPDKSKRHVLLYLDLDQFKVVNDTSGHVAGDSLLIQVAGLLRDAVKDTDIIARLGGDEFAIFLPDCSEQKGVEIAETIKQVISSLVFFWEDRHFNIGVSIGLVPGISSSISYSELMQCADLSCYVAKDHGRNRIHIYRDRDQDLKKRFGEMEWVTLIRDGIQANNFLLYAQQVDAIDSNNTTKHIEILLRYRDENGKLHLPDEFLPAAEKYTLAPMIDRWVIEKVLTDEQLLDYMRRNKNMHININLSGLTVSDADITEFIITLLTQARLPQKSVCFEITETAAVSNLSATSHMMRILKLNGCEFALDDFGIGVSSFAYLKNLPVDYLKIDGSFITDIDTNPVNKSMVAAINQVGHVMRIQTVAEYVESPNILNILSEIGVDYSQGYFIHKPCPLAEYINVSNARTQKSS